MHNLDLISYLFPALLNHDVFVEVRNRYGETSGFDFLVQHPPFHMHVRAMCGETEWNPRESFDNQSGHRRMRTEMRVQMIYAAHLHFVSHLDALGENSDGPDKKVEAPESAAKDLPQNAEIRPWLAAKVMQVRRENRQ